MQTSKPQVVTIPATIAHRKFGDLIRRVFSGNEQFIVEKDGLPVAAIISMDEYHAHQRERQRIEENLREFEQAAREIGEQFKDENLTEEELMAQMKEIRRQLFRETYGDLK